MIVDSIINEKNKLSVSTYSTASEKIKTQDISFLVGEPLVWTISDQSITTASIEAVFPNVVNFDSLELTYKGGGTPFLKYMYTLDGNHWAEFPLFMFVLGEDYTTYTIEEQTIIESYNGTIFKINFYNNQKFYTVVTSKMLDSNIPNEHYNLMSEILDQSYLNHKLVPIFIYNPISGEPISVYSKMKLKGIKVMFSDLSPSLDNVFELLTFKILTICTVSLNNSVPSIFWQSLFKPKYFEDYPFIPDITKTFLDILEDNPTQNVYYGTSNNDSIEQIDLESFNSFMYIKNNFGEKVFNCYGGKYIYIISKYPLNFEFDNFIFTGFETSKKTFINKNGKNIEMYVYKSIYLYTTNDIKIRIFA